MKLPQAYTAVCTGVNIHAQKQNRMTNKYLPTKIYVQ